MMARRSRSDHSVVESGTHSPVCDQNLSRCVGLVYMISHSTTNLYWDSVRSDNHDRVEDTRRTTDQETDNAMIGRRVEPIFEPAIHLSWLVRTIRPLHFYETIPRDVG